MSKKCQIEIPTSEGFTPLHLALELNDNISAKILIENGAEVFYIEPDRIKASPLIFAIRN